MQLNALQKVMKYRITKEMIVLFLLSMAIGLVPYGYVIILAVMGYLFLRENEEKYICLIGYLVSVLIHGITKMYEQTLLIAVYFALLMALHMFLHNPSSFVYGSGLILLVVFGKLIKQYPESYLIICCVLYLLIAYEMRSLLFEKNQAFIFLVTVIVNCLVMQLTFFNNEVLKLVLLSVLAFEAMYLDIKPYLILFFISCILYSLSFTLSSSFFCVLLCILLSKESKVIAILLYVITAYSMDISVFEIAIMTGCFLVAFNMTFEKYTHIDITSENQSSIILMERLADICHEFPDDSRMQSMETVLRSSGEEMRRMNEEHTKAMQIRDILAGYYYDVINVELTYNAALYVKIKMNDVTKTEIKEEVIPILESFLKTPVYLMEYSKANMLHSYHECTLVVYPFIKVKYDYLQSGKDTVCGDYIMALKQGEQQMFVLSDGMGYGVKAKEQSSLVAKILMELSYVNMPFLSVLRLLNDILMARQLDSYATLDLLSVDTITKQAYLYKAGSFDTYLVRNNKVYSFKSDSIPLGIVSKIDVNVYSFKVQYEDVIIMVSDGFEHPHLKKWILENAMKSTGMMVKNIYAEREKCGIDDDVSILVLRMENCFNFL